MKDQIEERSSQLVHVCNLSSCEKEALNEIQTHDLCEASAVLYQLGYQAIYSFIHPSQEY